MVWPNKLTYSPHTGSGCDVFSCCPTRFSSTSVTTLDSMEGSLPQLQAPATSVYPVPVQSTPPHPTSCGFRFSIIMLPKPWCSRWSVLLRSGQQNPLCTSPVSCTCYMPRPSHCSFDHPNNIWWLVQIVKLLVTWSSPVSCYFIRLMSTCLCCHPMPEHSTYPSS